MRAGAPRGASLSTGARTVPAKGRHRTRRGAGAQRKPGRKLGPASVRPDEVASGRGLQRAEGGLRLRTRVWGPGTQTAGVQASVLKSKGLAFGARQAR